ncbi:MULTISPECIES: DUF488 domain-containing protein [Acidithiobacillus]|uniref:DUF488 domain-containing protein n=1 Tax=Acidithiobacillus TaxID=119977 RepID=UPI00187A0189|nr:MULTISPECIES: DUF488 family protein [Acidithiobacillus]MBE7567732.1 DUF488 family protein [Acidithiobacillus sp. HP-11]MBU2794708.1 DUF488 family protein [Acidithiobacillus thiooxidans]
MTSHSPLRSQSPEIITWRVYERPLPAGYHVLAERLWPRGVRKEDLPLDDWPKELTPSTALRQWFGHVEDRWTEFRERYLKELAEHQEEACRLLDNAEGRPVILLYAAHDKIHNGAVVLREFLLSQSC